MRSVNIIKIALVIASLALVSRIDAETARWLIKPQYQSVTQLSENLYKVKSRNSQSVLDSEGRSVVSGADSITPFYEGLALVLKRTPDGKMLVESILRADKSVATVGEEVYVVDQFPFFSEGLLPVMNKSGKAGYMDANGHMSIPFKYSNPHPFSGGLAAVSKGKGLLSKMVNAVGASDLVGKDKVFYINALGGEIKLAKEIGDIFFGSTFKNGEALVINKNRQYCIINPNGQLIRVEPSVTLRFDERYALTDIDEQGAKSEVRRTSGPDVFSAGNKLGYRQGSKVILPAQFSYAEPFDKQRAIATLGSGTGVLGLLAGDVVVNLKKGTLPPTASDVESADLIIVMPKEYIGTGIEVEVADKDGKIIGNVPDADDGTGKHTVSLMLPKGDRTIKILAENLELWNSGLHPGFGASASPQKESGVKFSFSATEVKANAKDAASVSITITNETSETLSGPVKMSGATPSVKKVSIPAGGKKTIVANFSKVVNKEVRTVTVTINGHSTSRKITLQPFFNF